VNMASSSYRVLDVLAMFSVVEKELRGVLNSSIKRGSTDSIWGCFWTQDTGVDAYRAYLMNILSSDPQRAKRAPADEEWDANEQQLESDNGGSNNVEESAHVTTPQKKIKSSTCIKV
jgi:hypothetical protein